LISKWGKIDILTILFTIYMTRRKITDELIDDEKKDKSTEQEEEERKQITQRMPKNILESVDDISNEMGISRNATINLLVKKGLDNW